MHLDDVQVAIEVGRPYLLGYLLYLLLRHDLVRPANSFAVSAMRASPAQDASAFSQRPW
jgi:hypothetical protein